MPRALPNRWVVLRVREDARPGFLRIQYLDDRCRRATVTWRASGGLGRERAPLPEPLLGWMHEATKELASVRWARGSGALPVFIRPDLAQRGLHRDTPALLAEALEGLRAQVVILAAGPRPQRDPFTLPLNLHTLDARARTLLQDTRAQIQDLFVRAEHPRGLSLEHFDEPLTQDWFKKVRPDILIGPMGRLREFLKNLPDALEARPRLLIALDAEPREVWQRLPPGVSMLSLRKDASTQKVLGRFLEALAHDSSLADAFYEAGVRDLDKARLVTDPRGNDDLLMSRALGRVHDAAISEVGGYVPGSGGFGPPSSFDAIGSVLSVPGPGGFGPASAPPKPPRPGLPPALQAPSVPQKPSGMPAPQPPPLRPPPQPPSPAGGVAHPASAINSALQEVIYAGRVGLAEVASQVSVIEAAKASPSLEVPESGPVPDDDADKTSEASPSPPPKQERRVDLRLERLEGSPLLAGGLPALEYQWVGPRVALRKSGKYRLRVQIGLPLPGSIMVGAPPPIDPLLPPPPDAAGHELEVVVYPLDFKRDGRNQKKLRLPLHGASAPLHFTVRAPDAIGPARLRVGVYRENHLLQSFLVSAVVEAEERELPEPTALRAELEFARSASFQNLDALTPRALCIGVNEDPTGATHTFMVKGGGAGTFRLTESFLSVQVAEFRKILAWAAIDERGGPRFASRPPPDQPVPPAFHDVARQLADWGGQVYQALFSRGSEKMQAALRAVATSEDGVLQFVRHDTNFVFPWAAVYDFKRPEPLEGVPPPPVCNGFVRTPEGKEAPCGHRRQDAVYCVRGFWGVRHRLEQVLSPYVEDAVREISLAPGQPRVELAVGTQDDYTRKLQETLRERFGPSLREVTSADALLDLLWDSKTRPGQLIVMGHLETRPIAGEPPGPRLVLPSRERWLRATAVTDRAIDEARWAQPRPLVFLMACSAAATQLSTPNDLLLALASAGASAVVGTECIIFSGMASRFSDEVTDALWRERPLAAAVKDFRVGLLKEGNPIAFAFTVYGDAELTLRGAA